MKETTSGQGWCLRVSVALVWLYQGLWHKLVAVDARHLEIVAAAPSFLPPPLALGMIGAWETLASKWLRQEGLIGGAAASGLYGPSGPVR